MMRSGSLASLAALVFAVQAAAETVPDRKAAVLDDRASLEQDPRWIYDDYERAFAEAKRTGKPLLVVLRCIPCLACAGIDARVLLERTELSPLLDQFVCVRVINANALDLSRFQFDFDLSFTAMFFNGDGTVYGRFGSWAHQRDPNEGATDGFRRALEGALEIHRGFPANRESLKGKQGRPTPYKTPVDMPTLQGKYTRDLDWEGKVVASCVHCHQIGDALRSAYRERKERLPANLVFPFPAPEIIGIELAPDNPTQVKSVDPGSAAGKAGLRAGDDLVRLEGQPILSIADVSWVLHHGPEVGSLQAIVRRDGEQVALALSLPDGWRSQSDISRRVGTWGMRAMALGGLLLEDLADEERARRGLKPDQLALIARHVGEYNEHAAAKRTGFRKEDVIVELAGSARRESESQAVGRLIGGYQPGDPVTATVLRGTERIQLTLPIQ